MLLLLVVGVLSAVATVAAQEMAPSPAPSMKTGSASAFPISGLVICSSLVVSLLALMKQ
uniref:Uncharacterized protein n=1 Tax=Nelumbo nucifera TaxID=4432 RepID=A0A822YE81_NELNU|nr:TPA_asm: hypothetical protein HUJ06_031279 [Nelumbo nucifera]